jgi:hypothetical protein
MMRALLLVIFLVTAQAGEAKATLFGRVDSFAAPSVPGRWLGTGRVNSEVWNDAIWHIGVPPRREAGDVPQVRSAHSEGSCASLVLCLRAIGKWQEASLEHPARVLIIEFLNAGKGEMPWSAETAAAQIRAGLEAGRLASGPAPQPGQILVIVKGIGALPAPVLVADDPEAAMIVDMRKDVAITQLADAVIQPGFVVAHHTGHFSGWSVGEVLEHGPDAVLVERDLMAGLSRR